MKNYMPTIAGVLIAICVIALLLPTCSRPETAEKVLKDQGYTHIQTTGMSLFGKGQDDWWGTSFTAVSPAGVRVEGVVSGGLLFKGTTVRFK